MSGAHCIRYVHTVYAYGFTVKRHFRGSVVTLFHQHSTHSRTWWHALQVAAAEPVRERERGVEGLQRRDRLAVAYAQRAALLLEEQVAALGLGQRERDREAARAG